MLFRGGVIFLALDLFRFYFSLLRRLAFEFAYIRRSRMIDESSFPHTDRSRL